jgi:spermidine synthase
MERMSEAFSDRAVALPHCASGNVIALAATGEPIDLAPADLRTGARRLHRETGLNLLPTVSRLLQTQIGGSDRFQL